LSKLTNNFVQALELTTLKRCSRWAEKVRFIPNTITKKLSPWTFIYHPWLKQLHDDNSQEIAIQKAAQMGFSEYAINRTLFYLSELKRDVIYALPNQTPNAGVFSKARLNPSVETSPYLADLFRKVKSESHKMTRDNCNLYITGAKSRMGFKEKPCSLILLDEVDEMTDEAINLARYRLSGNIEKQLIALSTPSVEGMGVNVLYEESSKNQFMFRCPHCSKSITLAYPSCLVICGDDIMDPRVSESHLICPECKHKLEHKDKPTFLKKSWWQPLHPDRNVSGYHINQLYSYTQSPVDLAMQFLRGRFSLQAMIEFYNSSLGLTYETEDTKLSDKQINDQIRGFMNDDLKRASKFKMIVMGVDVGQQRHHVSILGLNLNPNAKTRDITVAAEGELLYHGTVGEIEELRQLMHKWRPRKVVIDAQPDLKKVATICKAFTGLAYACYYKTGKTTKEITLGNVDSFTLSVHRTYWVDAALDMVRSKRLTLPSDLSLEYRSHLKAIVKKYDVDNDGNLTANYITRSKESDHFCHSLTYCLISCGLLSGSGSNSDL